MASALAYAKYDYKFEFGTGHHSGKHGGAILPDSLRWLWREEKVNRPDGQERRATVNLASLASWPGDRLGRGIFHA